MGPGFESQRDHKRRKKLRLFALNWPKCPVNMRKLGHQFLLTSDPAIQTICTSKLNNYIVNRLRIVSIYSWSDKDLRLSIIAFTSSPIR